MLRRSAKKVKTVLVYKNIELDENKHTVLVDGAEVDLTYKEYEILKHLIRNKGIVLTRDRLMEIAVRLEYLRKIEVGGSVFEVADKWPDSVEIVKLETAQECLMGVVKRIYVVDSLLFISDSNEKLFVFDRSGKFRNTIGTLGRGNDELCTGVLAYKMLS